jgi:hypothetical protein
MFLHAMQKRCPCLSDLDQHLFRFTESTEQNSQQGQSTDFQAIEPTTVEVTCPEKAQPRTWYAS